MSCDLIGDRTAIRIMCLRRGVGVGDRTAIRIMRRRGALSAAGRRYGYGTAADRNRDRGTATGAAKVCGSCRADRRDDPAPRCRGEGLRHVIGGADTGCCGPSAEARGNILCPGDRSSGVLVGGVARGFAPRGSAAGKIGGHRKAAGWSGGSVR